MQKEKDLLAKIEQAKEQAKRSRRNYNKAMKDLADYRKEQDKRLNLIAREVLIYWVKIRAEKHDFKNIQQDNILHGYLEKGLALATANYPNEKFTAEDLQTFIKVLSLAVSQDPKDTVNAKASNGTAKQDRELPLKEKSPAVHRTPPENQEIPMQENNALVDGQEVALADETHLANS